MGSIIPKSVRFNLPNGEEVIIETGKLATQAHGSCVVRIGKTMLFASVVSNFEMKEDIDFFPLSVDYQEKFASAGRIPGNFFRREAKLSDYEVLISRLVDRAIRPMFADGYRNETQIIINLISGDEETMPDCYAALAASAALSVSDIPFEGPISEVRVAKIDGNYTINPTRQELKKATLDLIVAGTSDNIIMVEGEANECQENEIVEAIKIAHETIKVQCNSQMELAKLVGDKALVKRDVSIKEIDEVLKERIDLQCKSQIEQIASSALPKLERKAQLKEIYLAFIESQRLIEGDDYLELNKKTIEILFDKLKKETIRNVVLDKKIRLDGRSFTQVRPIWTEIDYIPSAHGSAIFTRGETQALMTLTMGTKRDGQLIDNALEQTTENFILHYNFPALSVGEIKPNRGPGRREVGHANLAARSIRKILPGEYPYTIRLVSDILESNGSSSMATVCSGSMALMDGGIPVKAAVAGIAMGMISEGDRVAVLTDILGDEDALGDMDFKVTGTGQGITACQMDIKINGLSYELLEQALNQAKEGRLHILSEMSKTISSHREEMKENAPKIVEVKIPKDFIGEIIGPGGKHIQELQSTTNTIISIEEIENFGIVNIYGKSQEGIELAKARVERVIFKPEIGATYDGTVIQLLGFGAVVEFCGKTGLLHVSEIDHRRVENVEDVFKEGDKVQIKLLDIDPRSGKYKLSRKALLPRPENHQKRDKDLRK